MALAVTKTVAPVSARIAGQRPVTPMIVVTRSRLSKRFLRLIDITGTIKRKQAEQRRELVRQQLAERRALASTWRGHREGLHEHVEGRFAQSMADLDARTKLTFGPIRDRHKKADRESDRARQARAAEREAAELRLEEQIREAHERNRRQEFKGFVHKPRLGPKL